ncbi:hypothetical protein PG996_005002 [Apiospora saccharicola]|uniref:Uncharacterized protein n=1 Tax=Apiospora saccharicola TaxID=335842 RepID=A0ABR1VK96_9PEZI
MLQWATQATGVEGRELMEVVGPRTVNKVAVDERHHQVRRRTEFRLGGLARGVRLDCLEAVLVDVEALVEARQA